MQKDSYPIIVYMDTNIVLDLIFPSRNNIGAQLLLKIIKKIPNSYGAISSFCSFEIIEHIQKNIYLRRAIESDYSIDDARKFNAGPLSTDMMKQAAVKLDTFLTSEAKHIFLVDPEDCSCWSKGSIFSKRARFEASDLCHVVMAIGIGASSFATNDKHLYDALREVSSRRLGLTPIHCSTKMTEGNLRRIVIASSRRVGRIKDRKEKERIRRFINSLTTESGEPRGLQPIESLDDRMSRLEQGLFERS